VAENSPNLFTLLLTRTASVSKVAFFRSKRQKFARALLVQFLSSNVPPQQQQQQTQKSGLEKKCDNFGGKVGGPFFLCDNLLILEIDAAG
jgi:hypothetical protein